MHGYPIDHLCVGQYVFPMPLPFNPLFPLQGGDFVPVVVGRSLLESLHHSEVFVKQWGAPLGNQYYRSFLPDVFITICSSCNKVSACMVALAFSQLCEQIDTGYSMWLWLGYLSELPNFSLLFYIVTAWNKDQAHQDQPVIDSVSGILVHSYQLEPSGPIVLQITNTAWNYWLWVSDGLYSNHIIAFL